MRILILEDEQRAGEKLQDLISKHIKDATTVDWHRSIADGINYLTKSEKPDLIFSDIELIDGKSFEIYKEVPVSCPIIFCTAYNQFFLEAFKTSGIAYLLKPYTEDEFQEAVEKYRTLFKENTTVIPQVNVDVIHQLQQLVNQPIKKFKKTFTVKKSSGVYLLSTSEIVYFQAQGDFVFAFDFEGNRHILNYTLSAINELIDPEYFHQINRSEIVNFNSITKYHAYTKNRLEIYLKDGKTTLYTSNSRSPEFRSWVESK
ncbi:LytTR family DNA-binding domain-containing protein [uncultured Croceitalea sp.]|uniref:LytR/AlgR family response regulator transcription factor n=1 Tax=uncultured Croceitalea sp. TaxID=1798908 RepID=UPI0033063D4D